MRSSSARSQLPLLPCLLLAGCLGGQTLHGTATIEGQATSAGIGVCGACPPNSGGRTCFCTTTAADGSYVLRQEQDGPNWLDATAVSTLEGHLVVEVDGSGDVEAPPIVFTPLGGVEGQIVDSTSAGISGVVVGVDGTSSVATTGSDGHYTLAGVLSGAQTLTAGFGGKQYGAPVVVPYDAVVTAATITTQ